MSSLVPALSPLTFLVSCQNASCAVVNVPDSRA